MDKIKRHEELCKKIHEVYKAKNLAYGDSFGQENKKSGVALRYHSRGGILFFVHKRGFYC